MTADTFVAKCLAGEADLDAIDDFVDAWHDGAGPELELREFLGMTPDEYALWVEQPGSLSAILSVHRFGAQVPEAVVEPAAPPSRFAVGEARVRRGRKSW